MKLSNTSLQKWLYPNMAVVEQTVNGSSIDLKTLIKLRAHATHLHLAATHPLVDYLTGSHSAKRTGRGIEFEEVRAYQPGDDLATIDWRVTARTGNLHTKIFRLDKERPIVLYIDLRASMWFGTQQCYKSVLAAKLASVIAWSAHRSHEPIAAVILNTETKLVPVGRSQAHILQLLKQLATAIPLNPTAPPLPMPNLTTQLKQIARPGSAVIILSDFAGFDERMAKQFQVCHQSYQLMPCFIYDTLERTPPKQNRYSITNDEGRFNLNTQYKTVRDAYEKRFIEHYMRVKQSFEQLNMPLLECGTHEDVLDWRTAW